MGARFGLLLGSILTAALGGYFGAPYVVPGADRRLLLPGRTSHGHHLIESECAACHTPFERVENAACLKCHEASLAASDDTHPARLFTAPRNADRNAGLDARACATCHKEHAPARTREGGVTLPADFCYACHADIGRERPSHAGFAPTGCAATGCHRFHDNRGLYEGFLAQHLHDPEVLPSPHVPLRSRSERAPAVAPDASGDAALVRAWAGSEHARAGVSCTPCHSVQDDAAGTVEWKDRPGSTACGGCHAREEEGFLHGPHGMRTAAGLSPLVPAMAQLPMRLDARDKPLGCEACHGAHGYDTRRAAVEACLGCHDDAHSRAYRASRHALLWDREVAGSAPPGTGVSCATCHLPRVVVRDHGTSAVRVEHDQGADLRPRDKMLRAVCLSCHGLGFSIDALADRDLVDRNFNGRPSVHVGSLSMVERRLHEGGEMR